jgi:hypothetical protein
VREGGSVVNIHQRIVSEVELPATFVSKVSPEPNSGCWLWAASVNNSGYGTYWNGSQCHTAHRFCFETVLGPHPNCDLDHLCRVRCCVNPAHLEPVTRKINCLRGVGYGKFNRRKTHCPKGHPLEGVNLEVIKASGSQHQRRRCIICRNANQRAYNARRSGR